MKPALLSELSRLYVAESSTVDGREKTRMLGIAADLAARAQTTDERIETLRAEADFLRASEAGADIILKHGPLSHEATDARAVARDAKTVYLEALRREREARPPAMTTRPGCSFGHYDHVDPQRSSPPCSGTCKAERRRPWWENREGGAR